MDMTESGCHRNEGTWVSLTQAIDPYLASKPIKRIMASSFKVGNWTEKDIQH